MKKENNAISLERRQFFAKGGKLATGSLLFSGLLSSLDARVSVRLKVPQVEYKFRYCNSSKLVWCTISF